MSASTSVSGGLRYLYQLDVSNNHLTGSLPPDLDSYPYLRIARFDHNGFTGTIPESFGNISSPVREMALNDNRLCGDLGPLGEMLSNLRRLRVYNNDDYDGSGNDDYDGSGNNEDPHLLGRDTSSLSLSVQNNYLTGSIVNEEDNDEGGGRGWGFCETSILLSRSIDRFFLR